MQIHFYLEVDFEDASKIIIIYLFFLRFVALSVLLKRYSDIIDVIYVSSVLICISLKPVFLMFLVFVTNEKQRPCTSRPGSNLRWCTWSKQNTPLPLNILKHSFWVPAASARLCFTCQDTLTIWQSLAMQWCGAHKSLFFPYNFCAILCKTPNEKVWINLSF